MLSARAFGLLAGCCEGGHESLGGLPGAAVRSESLAEGERHLLLAVGRETAEPMPSVPHSTSKVQRSHA